MTRIIPNNRISLLQNGEAYFPAIEAALDRAEHEIYLESYIFENDKTGRRIAEALKRAALRGVKTHLLIDGFGSSKLPQSMIDDIEAAGAKVLKFRPKTSPWTLKRQRLRRLHRKIVAVDHKIAFVGGINIIDDTDIHSETSTRFDYAIRVEGPLAKEILNSARRVWARVTWTRLRPGWGWHRDRQAPSTEPGNSRRTTFLIRDNIRHRRDIEDAYLQAIKQAQFEIILANAYFLPGLWLLSLEANVVVVDAFFAKELKQSLGEAIELGAHRIFENSWSTQSFRQRLASWLSYGLVRIMIGLAGYAPIKEPGATRAMPTSAHGSNRLWKR